MAVFWVVAPRWMFAELHTEKEHTKQELLLFLSQSGGHGGETSDYKINEDYPY